MNKRKTALAISAIVAANTLFSATSVLAAPATEDSKWVVVTKLRGIEDSLDNTYTAQYGLYYNLYYLVLDTRWSDLATDYFTGNNNLGFSKTEKQSYDAQLLEDYKAFNAKFGKAPADTSVDKYVPLTLPTDKDFLTRVKNALRKTIPTYLEDRLKEIKGQYDAASNDAEKNQVIKANRDNLRYIYKILDVMVNESKEMEPLILNGAPTAIGSDAANALFSDSSPYKNLLNEGKALDTTEVASVDNVGIPENGEYLERLAQVTRKDVSNLKLSDSGADNWVDGDPSQDGFQLQQSYLKMFAASAVYRPFISYAGDPDFLQAMSGLFTDDNKQASVTLYNQIKDFRKPLYYISEKDMSRVYDQNTTKQNYTGEASLITLSKFLDMVDSETLFGLVLQPGKLQMNADTNSYAYFSDNPLYSTVVTVGSGSSSDSSSSSDNTAGSDVAPTDSSSTDSSSAGVSVKPSDKLNKVISNATEDENGTNWSAPIFASGGTVNNGLLSWKYYFSAQLTDVILKNYIAGVGDIQELKQNKNQLLFINAFGDIVTQDNRIIFPGAANPMYYLQGNGDMVYQPFTVAFMQGYPGISLYNGEMSMNDSKGRYVLFASKKDGEYQNIFVKVKGNKNYAFASPKDVPEINFDLSEAISDTISPFSKVELDKALPTTDSFGGGLKFLWQHAKMVVGNWKWLDWKNPTSMQYGSGMVLIQNQPILTNTDSGIVNVFDYNPDEDPGYKVAQYIARNMYLSFLDESKQIDPTKLDQDFMFKNVLLEALNGTIYASGYAKNLQETLDNLLDDGYGWWLKWNVSWAKEVLNWVGGVSGVLGIANSYEDPVFGWILTYANEYFIYGLLVFFIIFIVKYAREEAKFVKMVFMSAIATALVFTFVKIFPVYLPIVYNAVANQTNRDISYNLLAMKAEMYGQTYKDSGTIDANGKFVINTTGLNLYKLKDSELKSLLDSQNLKYSDVTGGNISILDQNNGIYLEGNTIKVNVDTLLFTNPITGSYQDTETGTVYQLKADKEYSSAVDYYMPFYQIEDGFIDTLNRFLMTYTIPKNSTKYLDGLTKDSFLVYNYVNSAPFLTPTQYRAADGSSLDQPLLDRIRYMFDNPELQRYSWDFLNLDHMLRNPSDNMKQTLWYKSLVQNGIIPTTPDQSYDKYENFIESVNENVKNFILHLNVEGGTISDENLIKVIALYATTDFDTKASDYGNWIYPSNLNYQDYKLADVYLAALTNDKTRFLSTNDNVVDYVANSSGALAVILLWIHAATSGIIINLLKFGLPLLYVTFGFVLVIRYVVGARMRSSVRGYFKISALLFISLSGYVSSFMIPSHLPMAWSLTALVFINLIILVLLYVAVMSFMLNITEMGDSQVGVHLKSIADKLRLGSIVDFLRVNALQVSDARDAYHGRGLHEEGGYYDEDANIDEMLDDQIEDLPYLQKIAQDRRRRRVHRSRRYEFADDAELENHIGNYDVPKGSGD